MSLVSLRDVKKKYLQGKIEVLALKGISLSIEQGEFTAFCGPSGSGKTTLLNLVGGLDSPSSGSITLDGEELTTLEQSQLSDIRLKKIGIIFQAYNLIPVLSALENVEYVMVLQGVDPKEREDRAMDVLKAVGLEGLENRRPAELSGGQQQRVAVARAIVSKPSIVLADEPTANLDSKTGQGLLDMMLDMNKTRNVTFIFSTHDQMVMEYARRIINIKDGELLSNS